jgi:hypothetical protein
LQPSVAQQEDISVKPSATKVDTCVAIAFAMQFANRLATKDIPYVKREGGRFQDETPIRLRISRKAALASSMQDCSETEISSRTASSIGGKSICFLISLKAASSLP